MDVLATLITGIYWGLILNALWIVPYFVLLFYHFYQMENSPAYQMRYEQSERRVKKVGKKEAVIQDSNIRTIIIQGKSLIRSLKALAGQILKGIKKSIKERRRK